MLCLVTQSCLTLCDPVDCSPPGSSVHGDSPGKNTGVGCHALLQGIFPTQRMNPYLPGTEPRSPTLQADSLPSEPPGKTKNTGVGSLSLLQGIFLTQESYQGLLHCRQILYQLSYQGSSPCWCGKMPVARSFFSCLQCRRPGFYFWVRKIPWRRKWQPTPVFLPGESHGQGSLAHYSLWGSKSQTWLSN